MEPTSVQQIEDFIKIVKRYLPTPKNPSITSDLLLSTVWYTAAMVGAIEHALTTMLIHSSFNRQEGCLSRPLAI